MLRDEQGSWLTKDLPTRPQSHFKYQGPEQTLSSDCQARHSDLDLFLCNPEKYLTPEGRYYSAWPKALSAKSYDANKMYWSWQEHLGLSTGLPGRAKFPARAFRYQYFVVLFVSAFMSVMLTLIIALTGSDASRLPMDLSWMKIATFLFVVSAMLSVMLSHGTGDITGFLRLWAMPSTFLAGWLSVLVALATVIRESLAAYFWWIIALTAAAGFMLVVFRKIA
jgi:hypothetical protein